MLRYLYCVVSSTDQPDLSGWLGEGAPLEFVQSGGLAGVTGSVPEERYDAEALERASADVASLAPYVAAHQAVVQFVFERVAALVPLTFGSVHRDREAVRRSLEAERERLEELLPRFAHHQEWGLRLARQQRARVAVATGTEYLAARRAELRGELDAESMRAAERLERELAEAATLRRVLDERRGDIVLRVAYLVPTSRVGELKRGVLEAGPELERLALAAELSGPWPPYSFVRR